MVAIIRKPDTQRKLELLSTDAQYDLACACGTAADGHRRRGPGDAWIYPVTLPNGGRSVLFKTLLSNACSNDCSYCPLRAGHDVRRCTLGEEEIVGAFLDYYNRGEVFGLFLTSGVLGSPDATMERINRVARILRRRHGFRGYIHLKILPGSSDAAIEEALSLSSAVSLNIETPGAKHLARLSSRKRFTEDIVEPIKRISRLTARGNRYEQVRQTTQFVVGAAGETDSEIIRYVWGLYDRLGLHRVYYSAYQQGAGLREPGYREPAAAGGGRSGGGLLREHRLYQADFLMRRYGFTESDICLDDAGNLSLEVDPKELWARRHPEYFPLDVNKASRQELLRVPGLGEVSVDRILQQRNASKLRNLESVGRPSSRLEKAHAYLSY